MASPGMSPADEEPSSTDIDDRHYSLQVEQENTQKRTFTSWVNSQLEKHLPPTAISDLYADVGKGHVLLDLLEVLSGQQLPREKGSNTFQRRSNIENALTFLKNRSIKLINIHVADIIEGKPSIILGLIWTIILHFHIEELARTLACGYGSPSVDRLNSEGSSPAASPPAKRIATGKERWKMSAKKALLFWAKEQCSKHGSISVADFKSSWRNGLAFLAVIHALRPDLVDMERVKGRSNKENLKEAFHIAEKELNIPRLLEPEDVDVINPDEKSIMTYVAQFLQHFKSSPVVEEEVQGKVAETLSWLDAQKQKLTKLLTETENMPFNEKFQEMLSFMKVFGEEKKAFLPLLTSKGQAPELSEDYLKMRDAWDGLTAQMNEWKAKLDCLLPPPLDAVEDWLQEVEHQLAEDLSDSQEFGKAVAVLEGKMKSIQKLMSCFEQHWKTLQSFDNRDEAGVLLVPPEKLEEMRKRFSSIQLTDFNIFMEYYHSFCSAILQELMNKLNIWDIKYGTKEMVESQLADWQEFIEAKGFLRQLETALCVCEEKKNKILNTSNLGATPEDACKLFKLVESQISRCEKYIDNVNENLRKILTAWGTYNENIQLLKAWLEETRKEHPKKVTAEILAAWNSRHGSLNEAGNFLIESSTEEVGSAISGELKKLNRKWARLIKKTHFEMRLLRTQEEEMKIRSDGNGDVDPLMKEEPDGLGHPVSDSMETPGAHFESPEALSLVHGGDSHIPEPFLSEKDVKQNFEDAYKELEASVLMAMRLLDQKVGPEETISKHEEAFCILDTNILHKFLKAAEQLKDISPACEKAVVEEKSKDVRERWEAVRREIVSFVQLKMEVEREKLNKVFSKLNKQVNKEQKLLRAGKTKRLLEEHEAEFSQQGSLGELNTCLEAMKTMDEKMTEEEKQLGKKTPIGEYEQKKEELRRRASAVYTALVSKAGDNHLPKRGDFLLASDGENTCLSNPSDQLSPEAGQGGTAHKKVELGKKLQNGGQHAEKFGRDADSPSERLKESYDTASHNLKLHLSNIRENVTSALTDVKDISCFQNKLQELEALQNKGDSAWKWFASLQLEKISDHAENLDVPENPQEELLGEWNELHFVLNKRVESLKAVLALLSPIQNEWIQLCNADKQLRNRDVPHAVVSNSSLPFKKVKKMQASIADCTRRCGRIEQECFSRGEIEPIDSQIVNIVTGEYRRQLRELDSKIQALEAVLHDLETFLSFLNRIKQPASMSTPLGSTPKLFGEGELQEISLMKKEAKRLDEKLKQIDIRLDVAETGQKICCEEILASLLPKETPTASSSEEQETNKNSEVQKEFLLKNRELFKSIHDIHDKVSKIGLRDPTIPAVQQRSKLLSELRQKLERLAGETRTLNDTAKQLSTSTRDGAEDLKKQWGLTEGFWKKTKLAITERQEHCARVIELLKQYHSCKSSLASIIQKQEQALSQQASYMGKENLQRTIAKINAVKQEFYSHSEDVDRISQICKNLHSQLSKMKSFEEPPFENEANALVDRWLDINERTENYCDNLGRALALWDKLLNLSSVVDEWSSTELKSLEHAPLTGKELAELEAGLQFQESNLEQFDAKVEEIQTLLNGSEPPLELQVIKSSLLSKMEVIRSHLRSKSIPTVLNGNTAELKGDLDLAKTQIGMTESLLKALSPSDTLEIFTKLEEINQKILQQKHHVKLLQKETGCLSPEVAELKKQLKSITDLFNAKKKIFQDHFITLLNYQCEDFNEWFSSTQLSLKECFDPSETKEELEEKTQRLMSFLSFEGKGKEIHEVKTLLNQLKSYLPKANVSQLSNWVRDQEVELERITRECQIREQELRISLQQFARLEDEFGSLEEWLNLQEEKWQEVQMEKPERERFYQILLKQRESFDSFSWLANSLRKSGFSSDEVVVESSQLVSKYKMLLSHIRKSLGVSQVLSAEEKSFEDLAQNMFCWVQRLKESVLGLTSKESKMPADERLHQIKEIVLMKDEGNAKLENIASLGDHLKSDGASKNVAIQQMVSDLRNQWEFTIQLATEFMRHQEQLQLQKEQDKQQEDDIQVALCEQGKQKHELNLSLQRGSQETQSQLADCTMLLHEVEDLTLLLEEVAKQRGALEGRGAKSVSGESLVALRHLHGNLLSRLQVTVKRLEGHMEEEQRCKELIKQLKVTLKELLEPTNTHQKQVHQNTIFQIEDTLQEIIDVLDATRQTFSPLDLMHSKDVMDAAEIKQKKHFKTMLGHMELMGVQSNTLKQNGRSPGEPQSQLKADQMANGGKLAGSALPFAAGENSVTELLDGSQEEQLEEPSGMEDQMNREAQQLFQECATNKKQPPSSVATESKAGWPSFTQDSEAGSASIEDILHEDQADAVYADLAEKVKMVKIPAAELDIVLVTDQLKEIENLCAQLEKQKAQALLLSQGDFLTEAERRESRLPERPSIDSSMWECLLQELMAIKAAKENQFRLVNNYQECLAAVQTSMQHLSTAKENIKIRGPIEDTLLLENIKRCLASIHKERVLLQKLKSEHESLSRHLTSMDKELTQSQVSQVEQWWKQMEESLQRKQFQIAVEADEFKLFRDKVQDLQRSLQEQCHLQTGTSSCGGGDHIHPALLSTELQTLKHRVSLLRRDAEERMKRIWSDSGKKALESAIDDLQNQVEELEQLTPREDTKISSHCPQVCEIIKKVEEAILWAKISMLCVDENLALFPEDLLSQIENCKVLIRGAEEREATIEQLADEVRNLTPWLESNEASSLGLLSQKLQTCYQDLLQRLVQRSEQLESQLGKRQKLFADTEKFEAQLGNIERRSIPDGGKTNQKSELDHQQAILEETGKEVQEIEGLVDASYQDLPQGLNVFERLFLNDYLRSLRSRAKRSDRLIQIKHSVVQNQRDACTKLLERITALQQELSNLHCDELKLDPKEMLHLEQATESKLSGIKEKALTVQSSLSYLEKYKEIWDCLGLEWDAPCIKELQSQFYKTKGNFEQKVKCLANSQKALGEIEAIICNLQKHCNALQDCPESASQIGLLSGKILSWRVAHARSLSQEALGLLSKMEADGTSLKEDKMEQIKKLGEKIDGLAQTIQAMQEKPRRKQGLHSQLDRSLGILKGVKSQLQLPLLLDLETQTIKYEMAYCEVLEEVVEGEAHFAEKLIEKKSEALEGKSPIQDRLETELDELQGLEFQLKADIAVRRSTLEEAFQAVKSYNEAVEKAAELYSQCEALLHQSSLSLEELEASNLLWHQKRAEFESAKAVVEELASTVESKIDAKARKRLGKTLQDLASKGLKVKEQDRKRTPDIQRSLERYQKFKRSKEIIRANLNDMERMLQKSFLHVPMSYKDALELSEQSKTMASQLISVEEDLMKLRQGAGELNSVCSESDCALITMIVSALWLKWLYLLRTAKEWESKCEEQVQEWKSINEDLEREAIILDNLQEELPESPKEKGRATKQELQEFLECAKYYEESVDTEKLLLHLILQRLKNILSVPLCHEGEGSSPVVNEIHIMQDRTKELCQKVQKQKDAAEAEIGDRNKVTEDIGVVKRALGEIGSLLQEGEALNEKAANLEEIRRALDKQRQNFEQMMDGLRIKYSEMYTIVPVEIETHLEDCKQTLQDLEEKVTTELEKKSPHYATNKTIEEINKGLQAIENLLQQKGDNVTKAKDIQKRAWDLLDLWHYKMNELDSAVQEIVEDDPSQGPELMDLLMIPLQRYQQVSQSAERRTANLNKAAGKIEECDELLQSTHIWLENTNRLITEHNTESAKALNKHMSALQMAAEDSEQKQNMLTAICTELEEFSALLETGHLAQELNEVNDQVKTLQQKIMEILPHIQHLADEVEAIESEVKMMEKDVDKIKTILAPSEDTLSFSPKDHLKHGQVILAHISPMQKTVAEIQAYKEKLSLPDLTLKPLTVFQRTKELSRELRTLERITKEQNALLEPIVEELEKNEQEIDYLKQYQFLRSESDELATEKLLPSQGDEAEKIKQQIALLCERKEDILTAMKNSLLELHQRQDQTEEEDDILESPVSEENGDGVDWQPKKRGSLSLLPSLVEEVEDSSFHDDGKASSAQITNTAEPLRRRSRGDAEETVGTPRPGSEPAQVLCACQAQIAELKLCLKQAKETLGSETQTRQMQQTVEQHLAACQVSLAEIEQKVMQLLEDCKDKSTSDSPGLQQEAENLSSKLKDVKCNLERVQDMLQDKHVEKELSPDENISDLSKEIPCTTSETHPLNKSNGLEKQQELLLKLSEQMNPIDFLSVYMEEIQPEVGDGTVLELQSSFEIPTSVNDSQGLTLKDQAGDKWQYLQEELLFKANLSHCQFAEPQISTKINILPKGATSSVRTPTVEELKTYTAQLGSLSQEASVQIQENSAGEVSSNLDQKLFELLLAISRCLNNMEQMLNNYVLTSEEVPMQQALCETLSEELQKLHADIDDKKDDLLKSITCAGGNPDRFSQCFSNLQTWLQLTQAAVASKGKSMKDELNHHSNFQNEIRRLYDTLVEKKSKLQQDFSAVSGCSVSKQLQIIDTFEVELQNLEMQAAKLRDHGERHSFPVSVIHEVYKLEDVLDELWEILRAKQRELTSPFIDGQQYEALLRGLAELVALGQEKTAQVPELRTTSRANLQFHLQNHKSFFCNLNTHMLLVQTCSQKVAPSVIQKTEKFWNELVQDVRSLEKQAVQHGAHLERLLQDWIEFDDSYTSFCPKLEALSSTLPSVNLVEETEESLMERTQLLQQIKLKVEEEQAWYLQIVKEGRKLMASVNCPELQSQVEKLEEQWMSLSGKVDHELQRLETFFRLLSSYNRDSKELDNWLESAQHRVNTWETQSLHAAEDLNTVRNHLNNLLEFSKEVDDKSSLKSSVISTGNQLLLLKETSATLLRSFLAEYEQKWANLISQLPGIQEKFHQLQMAMMPSQEAIEELTRWMSHVNEERRDEAVVNLQSPVCQVKSLLKKYKEYLMEMNFKQWVVDYVNQSLLQTMILNVESKRYERTEFAERLGELNLQWHTLQGALNGKVKELEHILESIAENERKAQSLGSWFEAQSKRLQKAEKPASLAGAQETARNCKVLEYQLMLKSKDLDQLKQYYAAFGDSSECPDGAEGRINQLDEMRTGVVNQVAHLKSLTEAALEQWKVYDEAWDEIKLMCASASYCMEHCMSPVLTLETLKKQVESLQSLQDKTEDNEDIWARVQKAAGNLKKLCEPSFAEIFEQKYDEARTRWTFINKAIDDQLQKLQSSLPLWESYISLHTEVTAMLDKYEEQCSCLLMANLPAVHTMDFLKQKMQDVKKLELDLQKIKEHFLQASEPSDKLVQLNDPAAEAVLPEKLQVLQRISCLEKMLELKANEFQFGLLQQEKFEDSLEKLEKQVKDSTEALDHLCRGDKDSDQLMVQMASLATLSPEMESLNEISFRLPLSDFTTKRLQTLNWEWAQKTAMTQEQCSDLQQNQSHEKFLRRCQKWAQFLERMKAGLKENIGGTLEKLQEQQKEHEILQAQTSVNQQVFNSIVAKALHVVESGEAENRTAFISKLTLIKEQWQTIVWMVQQRKNEIDRLVKQWQKFTTSLQEVTKFLTETNGFIVAVKKQDKYSLNQVKNLNIDFKNKKVLLQRWQTKYSFILDTGERLLDVAAPKAKASLQMEMKLLKENWDNTQLQLEKTAEQFQVTIQTWESCERLVEKLDGGLHELKGIIKDPLPEEHDELQAAKEQVKELEKSLASWNQSAKDLGTMKVDLARYLLVEDMLVLREQVAHLHRQWEELCLRVSLRKQEIEDKLNAWIVFNEKNKELCAWLVQMESRVLQSADVSIEDMIDKLQKDCMEEINLFSENKLIHLKQMGDQLIKASNKSRAAEIDEKLNKINGRWQHLFDVIGGRVKKLKETFAFIQQLDKNMSNLRTWLARIESELSKPVVYDICNDQEIQKRLAEQQDLQRDIEQHSAGVESVFNICEVLLHDSDACANETECDSIQQTTRSLDRRWRNICAMSMERRMKIEETWRLWQKFLEDYSRFEEWLKTAERTAACPYSSEVSYTDAKEELKKFEAFQRQIHERLTQLELINKQYRRLARENRTDSASKLKQMVYEGNQRWDNLQKRVAAILRRLRHFTTQWEDFVGTKDRFLVWLTEMDLQLTNVEHFSENNFNDKMRQLNAFQQEIALHMDLINQLTVLGEQLIQKSVPSDAVVIQEELDELKKYYQEVNGRVSRFHQRLSSWHPGLEDEKESSENEADTEDSRGIQNVPWHKKAMQELPPTQPSLSHLMSPAVGHERSGCETPVSVDSIPLEWDHTGDVGGSSSPEDEEEPYYSALSGKSVSETHAWHAPESPVSRKHPYSQGEMVRNALMNNPETSTPYKPAYVKQLSTGSMDSIKEMSGFLPCEEPQDNQSSIGVAAIEKQPGGLERWELLQAQDLSKKLRVKQSVQQWQQLNLDLSNINAWLDKTEEELEELQESEPATSIPDIEQRVKKLKDMLKAFDHHKALVLSINLTSKDFKQADNTGSKELQNRLRRVNLRWEKANLLMENWRKNLQEAVMCSQDFHEMNQKLLLWLAGAEMRRHQAKVKALNADPHAVQESRKELMQLEKELLERQLQVNMLQEISAYLLVKSDGEDYIEADEKIHVIGKKLKQLLEGVSQDLKASQGSQDLSAFLPDGSELDSEDYHQLRDKTRLSKNKTVGRKTTERSSHGSLRTEEREAATLTAPKSRSFFCRVFRAALPLQLLFLLLLLLASMIPSSEEDYSCTQANNFARSLYPMLRYTNGPPPT